MKEWASCKKILCIRPDNMGDLIMSAPAMRALKESFGCTITLLTSSMAAGIVPFLPEIDELIQCNVPWVKGPGIASPDGFYSLISELQIRQFDAAVIFTVYSQNSLPSAMLAYLAGIPKCLAYCRENPYNLLTHWVPDQEPYRFVQHQVQRDLHLVETVGAFTQNKKLHLQLRKNLWPEVTNRLSSIGVDVQKPWLIAHAGVSERKREYPGGLWIETGRKIVNELDYQVILTGSILEKQKLQLLQSGIGKNAFNAAGLLSLEEFMTLIKRAPLVLSVNTSTIHMAAALETPVIVLYALSNPQHSPWMATGKVLIFDIPKQLRSQNEIVRYVQENLHPQMVPMVPPDEILYTVKDVLFGNGDHFIPDMIPLQTAEQVF
ncbi:MAG TPA: glycosyltransferase family 9 protein [Flavisolibacter sp.]|nr:glycosyltransferase family 9 protein [Flavisolibacter sp.]